MCDATDVDADLLLTRVPILIMFGYHLDDVALTLSSRRWAWADALTSRNRFVDQLKNRSGDAEVMHFHLVGIKGNSQVLTQDRNMVGWINRRLESNAIRSVNESRPTE